MSYAQIDDDVLAGTRRPPRIYFIAIGILGLGFLFAALLWLYQTKLGMRVTSLHQPVDWGVYLSNFIFWVGIAHSGTLISAIFFLTRAKWRDAVSRATEAMTVIAVGIAGLFPLIHLGRFWVFYYILPYPSQRQIWPNFKSPLVWDVLAISTYLTVSVIFFYIGLIPDAAAFRDNCEKRLGPAHWRTRLYRLIASGWSGAGSQWRHYGRSYLYFAVLVTPLVISVHSIVSWDFAVGIIVGWHSTLFAPYFVAGAIHSGLAMGLILLIPMRRWLDLKHLIRTDHLEMIAKTILVTTGIIAYSYVVEPLMAWYTGDRFEIQFTLWRAQGGIAPLYWSMFVLNIFVPLVFIFRKARRNTAVLFTAGLLILIGMWLERAMIVAGALAHDFMPHNWSAYLPDNITETGITIGSFCLFFLAYLVFAKTLPTVSLSDLKERAEKESEKPIPPSVLRKGGLDPSLPSLTALYPDAQTLAKAVGTVREAGYGRLEFFSPVNLPALAEALEPRKSPVRLWTLIGALAGLAGGFALAIGTSNVNGLIVGGKPPVSLIPYCIVGFEGLVLIGALSNLAGLFVHTWPYRRTRLPVHSRFTRDAFGLAVSCRPDELESLRAVMTETRPEEIL